MPHRVYKTGAISDILNPADLNLNNYPFAHPHEGRYVVMQFMGKGGLQAARRCAW